jgi:transposase
MIRLAVRRFRCLNVACNRKTFAERLDNVMASARRTKRLGELQRHLGLALGGEAGARLAERIAIPVSADTLLRMATSAPGSEKRETTPRVLAVDDWAWRRGRRYGTILVDLERNQVVDLLADRQADTLAAWLRENPGIEVVARDRAGAYADGIRQGAPDAVQVADRWHLLRNLSDAVQSVIDRQYPALRRIAKQIGAEAFATTADIPAAASDGTKPTVAEQRSQIAYARRQARYEEAVQLKAAGMSLTRIAAVVGAERKTVRRWLRAARAPLWRRSPRPGMLAPYLAHLDRRWIEGCHNATQLWRELVALGFKGRPGIVRQWAGRRRKREPRAARSPAAQQMTGMPPTARQTARLLMTEDKLSPTDQSFVTRLIQELPAVRDCVSAAKRLNAVLRRKSKEPLADVLNAAADTALETFVTGLRRDLGAVQAALELPWTTSPAEGQINRLKMLKRTMYGRAGFRLLRARVLHAT